MNNNLNQAKILLSSVIKEEFIETWLKTPNRFFYNRTPIEVIEREGLKPIEEMCFRLESGMGG